MSDQSVGFARGFPGAPGSRGPWGRLRRWAAALRARRAQPVLHTEASAEDLARIPHSRACILVAKGLSFAACGPTLLRRLAPLRPDLPDAAARIAALAWRWLALERRPEGAVRVGGTTRRTPIASRGDAGALHAEAEGLTALVPHERYLVAAARAREIPAPLHEIGRLREIAFRDAGEGTGREIDLDAFDHTYTHLLVWDRRAAERVGAYRLAPTERSVPAFGPQGLYSNTLFEYGPEFLARLGPAAELGRSFVRPEYQRSTQALPLRWRGIARLLSREMRAHVLFGAVSVSARYTPLSRILLARGLTAQRRAPERAGLVRPRRPLSAALAHHLPDLAGLGDDPAAIAALVADAEADGKAPPPLIGQSLKLGGRFVSWNVDPDFGDALDGLVVVDLRRAPRRLLELYMGRGEAAAFLAGCERPDARISASGSRPPGRYTRAGVGGRPARRPPKCSKTPRSWSPVSAACVSTSRRTCTS